MVEEAAVKDTSDKPPRITLQFLWQEVLSTLSWDKGLFFTIRELLIRPGEAIGDYLAGERNRNSNPIRFLVFTTAIASFITIKLDLFQSLFVDNINLLNGEKQQLVQDVTLFVYHYYNIITFLSVPILAGLTYLFFRRREYNYAEHLTLSAFLSAEYMVLYIFTMAESYYQPYLFNIIGLVAWFVYLTWGLMSFFPGKKWKIFSKVTIIISLQSISYIIVGGILALIFISLK